MTFVYQGQEFPARWFEDGEGFYGYVCPESLARALEPYEGQAQMIDEQVIFYVPDEMMEESDEVIGKYFQDQLA